MNSTAALHTLLDIRARSRDSCATSTFIATVEMPSVYNWKPVSTQIEVMWARTPYPTRSLRGRARAHHLGALDQYEKRPTAT